MVPDYLLFARIVELGSLSVAAAELRTSPASVSKRLATIEERYGVRLLHRTTRKLTLTAAGRDFYEDVQRILHAVEDAENRLIGFRQEPRGRLRVSAPTSFGRLHMVPRLHHFLARYPLVELQFDLSDEPVDLYLDKVDVAVRITAEIPAGASAHRLAPNHRILCASPAYLEQHGEPGSVDRLCDHRLLAAQGQLPWQLWNGTAMRTVDQASHVGTNSSEVVRELALCGVGIALRSLWDVDRALAEGALRIVLPQWGASADLQIYALHPKTRLVSPSTSAFVAFLREILDPPPWNLALLGALS